MSVPPSAARREPPPRVTYLVKRLELAVRSEMDAIVAGLGVTVPQYTALSVLVRHPGMSGAQLARRSFVSPQAGSEMLAVLERKGLVHRAPDAVNRRIRRVRLTDDGLRLLAACDAAVDDLERRMLAELAPVDVDRLRTFLGACAGALSGRDGGPPAGPATEPRSRARPTRSAQKG